MPTEIRTKKKRLEYFDVAEVFHRGQESLLKQPGDANYDANERETQTWLNYCCVKTSHAVTLSHTVRSILNNTSDAALCF